MTLTSHASEPYNEGDTTCVSSGQTTPTPTFESQPKSLPIGEQEPVQVSVYFLNVCSALFFCLEN